MLPLDGAFKSGIYTSCKMPTLLNIIFHNYYIPMILNKGFSMHFKIGQPLGESSIFSKMANRGAALQALLLLILSFID